MPRRYVYLSDPNEEAVPPPAAFYTEDAAPRLSDRHARRYSLLSARFRHSADGIVPYSTMG